MTDVIRLLLRLRICLACYKHESKHCPRCRACYPLHTCN